MQRKINLLLLLCSIMLCSTQCKKAKTEEQIQINEIGKLPAITQTGANTFGCLLNGNAWLPKGTEGSIPNSSLTIDNTTPNGLFVLINYRVFDNFKDRMTFFSDSIKL